MDALLAGKKKSEKTPVSSPTSSASAAPAPKAFRVKVASKPTETVAVPLSPKYREDYLSPRSDDAMAKQIAASKKTIANAKKNKVKESAAAGGSSKAHSASSFGSSNDRSTDRYRN